MTRKSIGELNGKWAFLLQLTLVLCPIITTAMVGFSIWVVRSIHQADLERAALRQMPYRLQTTMVSDHQHRIEVINSAR